MRLHSGLFAVGSLCVLIGCGESADAPDAGAAAGSPDAAEDVRSNGTEIVGRISATLGGEDRSWNVLLVPGDDGGRSTSVHRSRRIRNSQMRTLTLDGHVGNSVATRGMISLSVNTGESLDDCPCTLQNQAIEYWVSGSETYRATGASITIERFAPTSDGWFEASGRFSGTLVPAEENAGAGTGEPIPIEGTFDIDRIRALEI